MFVRWKRRESLAKEEYTLSAYLVKSVRLAGKPRQKVIAFLGSIKSKDLQKEQPGFWSPVEQNLDRLHLDEITREQVYQALAQKTPRPEASAIEQYRKEHDALLASLYSKPQKPNAPPLIGTDGREEVNGLAVQWERDGPYRGLSGEQTREELYHAFLVRFDQNEKRKVRTKLGDISPWEVQYKKSGWRRFWYSVHSALCLASVVPDEYTVTIQMIALRVTCPPQADWLQFIQEQQDEAEKAAHHKASEYMRRVSKWIDKSKELEQVRTLSTSYLNQINCSS